MSSRDVRIVVVGAGIGGLAAAIDLAGRGCRVLVLERAPAAGGKAREVSVAGRGIDGGPTVLTMPWVFDELFDTVGASFRSDVALERASLLARHFWTDGTQLDLHSDATASIDAISTTFGSRAGLEYRKFRDDARRIYETVEEPFLRSQRPTVASIAARAGTMGLSAFTRIDGLRTMWRALEKRFEAPRLRQLFGRYATYCGSSPFEAPATLALVAHVESEGVYRVRGGMRALASALEHRARALGVELVFGAEVERIVMRDGRVRSVRAGGVVHEADAVVFNGDVSALASGLLGREVSPAAKSTPLVARSLSALVWTLVGRTEGASLRHHNVFFSDDYESEFEDIFRRARAPEQPTVYACAQDRGDGPDAPLTEERLLVLVNAPATGDDPARWTSSERERCERSMTSMLASCGLRLQASATVLTTPAEFHRAYPATGGALYGPRSRGSMSALARAGAATRIPGLYLAGGSVHPGPGVPMAALSGRLAATRILADLDSISRSRTVGIAGITSTA